MKQKLNLIELDKREMEKVRGAGCDVWVSPGGWTCWCACAGPSSDYWNGYFNWEGGLYSAECFVGCNPQY